MREGVQVANPTAHILNLQRFRRHIRKARVFASPVRASIDGYKYADVGADVNALRVAGSTAMAVTGTSGIPVAPLPSMFVQVAPPLLDLNTWPTFAPELYVE